MKHWSNFWRITSKSAINHSEFIFISFAVDSLDAMLETVKSHNIPVHSGPVQSSAVQIFTVKDPNGVNVQFFQQ